MEIRELNSNWDEAVGTPDVESIKSEGISIRAGGKLIKFSLVEEVDLPEDEMRAELDEKFEAALSQMKGQFTSYKESMKIALKKAKDTYKDKEADLKEKLSKVNKIPNINGNHAAMGISVTNDTRGYDDGLLWFYNCVYQPKYINDRRLDPQWAKRLMTPIAIKIRTDNTNKCIGISVVKIIGHQKFEHYHLNGGSDCWGDFRYSGTVINTPEDAVELAKKALVVLQTVNEFSLGKRNPRGLSKFDTLKKHLLAEDVEAEDVKITANSRNSRSGFDTTTNDEVSANVWST